MTTLRQQRPRKAQTLTIVARYAKPTSMALICWGVIGSGLWAVTGGAFGPGIAPARGAPPQVITSIASETIVAAFAESHDGFSSDELLANRDLQQKFFASLAARDVDTTRPETRRAALLELLTLRKSGRLAVRATRRGPPVNNDLRPVAEIAARVVMDRNGISIDEMLANATFRNEFNAEAGKLVPSPNDYELSRAILALRKTRHLAPELVLRVADWNREILTYDVTQLATAIEQKQIPSSPGVYLFRDKTGYLYVGEAVDLSARLHQHLTDSDRAQLSKFLDAHASETTVEIHSFPPDSPAKKLSVRRAYESELIRSRNPRFNIRP